jgi:hypothetical protein
MPINGSMAASMIQPMIDAMIAAASEGTWRFRDEDYVAAGAGSRSATHQSVSS